MRKLPNVCAASTTVFSLEVRRDRHDSELTRTARRGIELGGLANSQRYAMLARHQMTSRQYARIEALLDKAEEITLEHPLLTPQGHEIKKVIHEVLAKVSAERVRAQEREKSAVPPAS